MERRAWGLEHEAWIPEHGAWIIPNLYIKT
jgi:hypothetical protein